jgi:predicted TIM-barrel fold metal-dependent hydrolase
MAGLVRGRIHPASVCHILFGTDWPAASEPTVVRNIANLTSFDGFTPEQLRAVERDNALRQPDE